MGLTKKILFCLAGFLFFLFSFPFYHIIYVTLSCLYALKLLYFKNVESSKI